MAALQHTLLGNDINHPMVGVLTERVGWVHNLGFYTINHWQPLQHHYKWKLLSMY